MRDLERRLVAKGYAPGETRWFQAIDVDLANSPVSREQLDRMRAGLQKLLEKR
jgi:hypothetical protein